MKGDFSRLRFNPRKDYTAVLQQQGRVSLDSDANEQVFIDQYLHGEELTDIIGTSGGPRRNCGFKITFNPEAGLRISPGLYYVDGILCANEKLRRYTDQPYLFATIEDERKPFLDLLEGTVSSIQVYLQVWQRLVTALDDPCLREPALGMADTTVRLQTIWRVILNPVKAVEDKGGLAKANADGSAELLPEPVFVTIADPPTCCQGMSLGTLVRDQGKLWARTTDSTADCSCEPTPASGYRGLENQLYRVEIHTSGDATGATFKWSRENGSVVAGITSVSGKQVFVTSLGPDANLGFNRNDWVEISDDTDLFGTPPNQPGTLYQIDSVSRENQSITLKTVVAAVDLGRNPRVRRWDQTGSNAGDGGIAIVADKWFTLENGIEVRFAAGTYLSGDYWLIPARTASGAIEWPPCGSNGALYQPPLTTILHDAPLACITLNELLRGDDGKQAAEVNVDLERFVVQDCRKCFTPLSELPQPPAAIHVTGINWRHDDFLAADLLVHQGLAVRLDQEISSPITGGNFIVTLEPVNAPGDQDAGKLESFNLLRDLFILEQSTPIVPHNVAVSGTTRVSSILRWTLPYLPEKPGQLTLLERIDLLISSAMREGRFARVRVRLMGKSIYRTTAIGQIYLDGAAFGKPDRRSDNSECIALDLPSGSSQRSSDFESWFYLVPAVVLESIAASVLPTQTVDANGAPTVTFQGSAGATLNYAPVSNITVQLELTLQTSSAVASNYITIPPTLTFPAGQKVQPIPLTILKEPTGAETFELSASLTSALGTVSKVSTTFEFGSKP